MMMKILRSDSGLSLTELVVFTALMGVLSTMVYGTFETNARTFRQQSARSMTQDSLRIWLERIVKEIRRAGYDPRETGLFGIESFSTTEIRFTADLDSDGVLDGNESLGFKHEGGTLWLRHGPGAWRPVLTGVGGFQLTYRDVKGNPVTSVPEAISFVEVALSAQATTAAAEGYDTSPSHSPSIVVGSDRTTVSVASDSTGAAVYGRVDRAALRNPF